MSIKRQVQKKCQSEKTSRQSAKRSQTNTVLPHASFGSPEQTVGLPGDQTAESARQVAVLQLQNRYGNFFVQRHVVQRNTQTITFDEPVEVTGRVAQVGTGRTATQETDAQMERLKTAAGQFWSRYRDGLNNFETLMQFESQQETEPRYLDVAVKATAKFILDQALGKLTGPLGNVASLLKGIGEAWYAERARAQSARGGVEIGEYIARIRESIGPRQSGMTQAIDRQKTEVANAYSAASSSSPASGVATQSGVVVGEAAGFINQLRQGVREFEAAIPRAAVFQQRITETFAAREGWTDLVSHGGRPAGQLYLSANLYKEGNAWTMEDVDSAWTLATTAPKPERLAHNLEVALRELGQKPYQSNLPKLVSFRIEIEKEWALNDYQRGMRYFTSDIDSAEVRGWYNSETISEAWSLLKPRIMTVSSVRGSSD